MSNESLAKTEANGEREGNESRTAAHVCIVIVGEQMFVVHMCVSGSNVGV